MIAPIEEINLRIAEHRHGRVPRELRLEQVMAVATELFATDGTDASMEELGRRVGVSKPVIYDLVGSKDQLLAAILDELARDMAGRVVAAVATEVEPQRQVHVGLLAFFEFVAEHRDEWAMLVRQGAAHLGDAVAEVRARQGVVVADLLEAALVGRGAVSPNSSARVGRTEVEALAAALNGATEAMAVWWLDHPELAAEDLAHLLATMVVGGLGEFGQPLRRDPPAE